MIEKELKRYIEKKFVNIRQFSQKTNIPYTTIDTILKRGIYNANVLNVIKICNALSISIEELLNNGIIKEVTK